LEITMKIAIPMANGRLSPHFGHCESFCLADVDPHTRQVTAKTDLPAPPHQPGLLPAWLAKHGAELIIAGGMGQRAQALFSENGIQVLVGVAPQPVEKIIADYLANCLQVGSNICDH
jgi:predicted Fe-Mo cluster-binding NifX family protein